MKECDILRGGGQNIYSDLPTYFTGGPDPTNPPDLRRWWRASDITSLTRVAFVYNGPKGMELAPCYSGGS